VDNVYYHLFKRNLNQFIRLLKISKLKNENINKYVGKVIYNEPFFTFDMVSSPSFRGATLTSIHHSKYIKVKKDIVKVGILKKLYYLCRSFLILKIRWLQMLIKK